MYKDKDKQREADRARQQRRRDVIKSKGVTNTGCDGQGVTRTAETVNPSYSVTLNVKPKRGKDIKCFADPIFKPLIERTTKMLNERGIAIPVTGKPADADYNGVCTEAWRTERGR